MSTPILDDPIRGLISQTSRCVMREVTVLHSEGIHLRPAAELVRLARSFQSVVRLVVGERNYETGSIIGLLSADLRQGRRATVIAEGADAEAAADAVERFFAGAAQTASRRPELRDGNRVEGSLKRVA